MANQNGDQGNDDRQKQDQNGSGQQNDNGANGAAGNDGSAENNSGSNNSSNGAKSGNDGEGSGSAASSNENNGEKMLSQSEVNKIATKEKQQGRQAVYNELGIDPKDEKTIALIKALTSANGSGDDGSATDSGVKDEELAKAKHDAKIAELKAEAMMQGCQKQFVEDAVTLAEARLATDEEADAKTIFGELKTKYPVWFDESEEDKGGNAGKKGTGSSMKGSSGSDGGKGETSLGAKLAAKRKGAASKKSSYWN